MFFGAWNHLEFLDKPIKQLFEEHSAVYWFETSNQINRISPWRHIIDIELMAMNLGQKLHKSSFSTSCLTNQ